MQILTEIVDLFFLESTISLIDTTSRALVYEISAWTRARNSGKFNEQQKGFCTPRGAWLPQFILVQLVPVLFLTKTVAKKKKETKRKRTNKNPNLFTLSSANTNFALLMLFSSLAMVNR